MAYTTIKKPSDYFNTKLYTGDGTNSRAVTGVGFQPDFTWVKDRGTKGGSTNYHHQTWDSVRGASAGALYTSLTDAEDTAYPLTSFDSDGITLRATSHNSQNETGEEYVLWNWLANGAGSANTDGSISSTVSANTTSGFSIVSYTGNGSAGATVGHGLGAVPKMLIVKQTNSSNNWKVYHVSMGNNNIMNLNDTSAQAGNTAFWNDTTPSSTLVTLGTNGAINASGATYVMYAFTDVQGYSKFGSYVGNGNADGTFVYTGMKPAFVIVKRTDSAQGWYILDNKRNTFNPEDKYLEANDSDAEATFTFCDFLSNGFKAKTTGVGFNASGGSYIYMAFAEQPLVGDNPATAR